jgi:hypothetical protein
MSLYPNPTHGTDVNINLSGVESDNVQIRIVDAMGRQVWSNRYSVNGVLNTNITFEQPLANGLYFVEAIFNGEVQTQRLMVQKETIFPSFKKPFHLQGLFVFLC